MDDHMPSQVLHSNIQKPKQLATIRHSTIKKAVRNDNIINTMNGTYLFLGHDKNDSQDMV